MNDRVVGYYSNVCFYKGNTYSVKDIQAEEIMKSDDKYEKCNLDKEFYSKMLKDAVEYIYDPNGSDVVLKKEYVQKIVDQLRDAELIVENDVRVDVDIENDTLSTIQIRLEQSVIHIQFETEFEEDEILEFEE